MATNLHCTCGAVIGELVAVNLQTWLRIDTVELRYAHGRCCSCRRIWHFDSLNYQLDRLITRVKRAMIDPTE